MLCLVARFGERTLKFPVPRERATIGSSASCEIPLPFVGVSRLHAWIYPTPTGARLEDAGSKNKLIIDGNPLDHVELIPGIVIQLGRVFLTIEEESSAEFDLAVAATPDPAPGSSRSDATDESSGEGAIVRDPAAGLRLIRRIEKEGIVEGVLSEALQILALESVISFELSTAGECAVSRVVGRLPTEQTLDQLEAAMISTTAGVPSQVQISDGISTVLLRSDDGQPDTCVAGILPERVIERWELDLFEYLGSRIMDYVPDSQTTRHVPATRAGLSLAPGMIVGESPEFRTLLGQLEAIADTRMDVLLVGETGTGKELLARTLHESGPTTPGPFVAINCAAIPTELLEAELFGVKGRVATGVDPRVGLFLEADGGSIFLDEIGELAEPLQAKLLRFLQEREVLPIGGSTPRKINVRVIAASNRDLLVLANRGEFRRDLYYRMSGLLLRVPALRDRKADIPALALGFLDRSAREHRRNLAGIGRKAMNLLLEHDWPGNIRELQNEVARAVLFSHDRGVLQSEHFGGVVEAVAASKTCPDDDAHIADPVLTPGDTPEGSVRPGMTLKERVEVIEKEAIVEALKEAVGNKSKAARRLGITRNGLTMKMKRLGLTG